MAKARSEAPSKRLASPDDAALLVQAFPGVTLGFHCLVPASIGHRDRAIAEQVKDGWPVATVAANFDLGERQVRRICQAQGVSPKAALAAARALRNWRLEGVRQAVLEAARLGNSIENAAYEWGFSPDVAHAILR